MARDLTERLEELKHEIERQDQEWAEVEREVRALSTLGIAVSRRVVDDIDEAFGTSVRAEVSIHHTFC
jgi:hypothetical protein